MKANEQCAFSYVFNFVNNAGNSDYNTNRYFIIFHLKIIIITRFHRLYSSQRKLFPNSQLYFVTNHLFCLQMNKL